MKMANGGSKLVGGFCMLLNKKWFHEQWWSSKSLQSFKCIQINFEQYKGIKALKPSNLYHRLTFYRGGNNFWKHWNTLMEISNIKSGNNGTNFN